MPLVLTRAKGETLVFILEDGREILVTLGQANRGQTRLLVDAPRTIRVYREELYRRKKEEANWQGPRHGLSRPPDTLPGRSELEGDS